MQRHWNSWFLAVLDGIEVGVRTAVLASAALTRRLRRGGGKIFVGFAFICLYLPLATFSNL
jgi:hypothetical protein